MILSERKQSFMLIQSHCIPVFTISISFIVTTLVQAHVRQWQGGEGSAASQGDSQHQRQAFLLQRVSLVCWRNCGRDGAQVRTNQRPVFRSRDLYWPIRGRYSGHMICIDQSEATIQVNWPLLTNKRPEFLSHDQRPVFRPRDLY